MRLSPSEARVQLIAWMLIAPAIAGAVWIGITEAREVARPLPTVTTFDSLADAIQHGQVEDAYAFISGGTDPNEPIPFSDSQLTGDHHTSVSPLMLAVATNKDNVVMMLLSFGARMDLPQNELAHCLARQLGHDDIAAMIARDARPAPKVTCPEVQADASAPLLAFVK